MIFALSIYSGLHRSPTQPSRSEWAACDKPLGVWACLWLVKLILQLCMGIWTYHRALRAAANGSDNSAEQSGSQSEPTPRRNPSTASNAASFRIGEEDYEESREAMSKDNLFTRSALSLACLLSALTEVVITKAVCDTHPTGNCLVSYCKHPHILLPRYLPLRSATPLVARLRSPLRDLYSGFRNGRCRLHLLHHMANLLCEYIAIGSCSHC